MKVGFIRDMKSKWLMLAVVFFLLFSAGTVSATTIIVCSDGSCNYKTIQDGINAANNGDTIKVGAGTYRENINIKKSINLIGAGTNLTIIDAASFEDHVVDVMANHVNITGITVEGATGSWYDIPGSERAGIYLHHSNYSRIEGVKAWNNNYGIYLSSANNNILTNNTAASYRKDFGIFLEHSDNNILTNNNVSNNDKGVWLLSSKNNTLIGNVMSGNNYNFGVQGGSVTEFSHNISCHVTP